MLYTHLYQSIPDFVPLGLEMANGASNLGRAHVVRSFPNPTMPL